jgi:7-cyano-7-deazaguanine synthase
MNSSVVLLSSGLDSTVNLYKAKSETQVLLVLTFDYGQKAAKQETFFSKKVCQDLRVPHKVIELPWFRDFTTTSLVSGLMEIPTGVNLEDSVETSASASKVWVPNRNGIFLSIGAAFAEHLKAKWLVPGFNAEEAATFPDNSQAYLEAFTASLQFSTQGQVEVKCFTTSLQKVEIYKEAIELGVNLEHVWPCYFGGQTPCKKCESCQRFFRAQDLARGV